MLLLTASGLRAQATNYPNGSVVANFTVTDLNGNTFSLYDLTSQGKYVMLDFFFAACGPCQATTPYFNQLHETYGCNAHDLFCLSVNNGYDNTAEVEAYEATYGGSYTHSPAVSNQGGGQAVKTAFGVSAFPTYCLISPDNHMIANDIWPVNSMASFVGQFPSGSIATAPCAPAGIPAQSEVPGLSIHPSPAQGPITVELGGNGPGTVQLEVLDMVGQLVRTISLGPWMAGGLVRKVDLGDLNDGQYLCRVSTRNGEIAVRRIVIAH